MPKIRVEQTLVLTHDEWHALALELERTEFSGMKIRTGIKLLLSKAIRDKIEKVKRNYYVRSEHLDEPIEDDSSGAGNRPTTEEAIKYFQSLGTPDADMKTIIEFLSTHGVPATRKQYDGC